MSADEDSRMSTDEREGSLDRELLVSRQGAIKIEEVNGKPIARFSVEPSMQGHTFAVDLSDSASEPDPTGPFRIEFVLGSEFVIHEGELPSFSFEDGFSHLAMTPDLAQLQVTLNYVDTKSPAVRRDAALFIRGSGNVVQRLVVETSENDFASAIKHTAQIVADLLDAIAFAKRIPISIRHIEVHAIGRKYQRRYMTLPYGSRRFTASDLTEAATIPSRLKPALRLFREGLSSSRPHYRLLCLYRVREVVESIRHQTDSEVLGRGIKPERPIRVLPGNELTRCYFPTFVGKKVGAFLDYVRSACRLDIAHANLNEYFKLILDPADVRTDHRIDFTNAALMPVVAEMIEDEIDFMRRFGIDEGLQTLGDPRKA
jgi:hypothetical protein